MGYCIEMVTKRLTTTLPLHESKQATTVVKSTTIDKCKMTTMYSGQTTSTITV